MTETNTASGDKPSLRSQTARGVAWMMLLKLAIRSLSFVSTLILVRLLSPEDFGLVAMAMVFIAIMDVFTWFSFDVVLIQKQTAERVHYDTAWTFNAIFKTVSGLVLLAIALPAAHYYGEPRVSVLIAVLAVAQCISGFENIGIVNFRKNMQFDREFRFMFLCKVAGFAVTVPLAFLLQNYWALIAGQVASKVFAVVASYVMDDYRPRFSLAARHELFDFSKWLMLGNIFFSIRLHVTELVVGKVSGARDLGLFNVSLELSNTPTTELVAPINRAVFPAYAKVSDNLASLRSGYLSVIAVIALIAMPAGLGIAATAELLVPVALGDQWLAAIPLFTILAVNGVLNALQTNIGSVYLALGKPKILAVLHFMQLAVVLITVIPATHAYGVQGAALAFLGTSLFLAPINFAIMFRTIKLRTLTFFGELWRAAVGSVVMYFSTKYVVLALLDAAHGIATLLHLLLAVLFGVVVYTLTVAALWLLSGRPNGAESYVLDNIKSRLRRRSAQA
ncbi:MAG: lipopolysaccharide biosynthesis protein [Gammaproteobacteria bacterium]